MDKAKVATTDGSSATVHFKGVQEFNHLGSLVPEKKVAAIAEICS